MKFDPEKIGLPFKANEKIEWKVIQAIDAVSSSNNEQIVLTLKCRNAQGKEAQIKSYILMWKVKQFCESAGLMEKFVSGELKAADCNGKTGFALAGIEYSKNPNFDDKNVIARFLKPEVRLDEKQAAIECAESKEFFNDDINF